jgi:hypothetical protein
MRRLLVYSCIPIILSACATAEIRKVTKDDTVEGVRFYRPTPYLLVSLTGAEGQQGGSWNLDLSYQIIWLPNTSQQYEIRPKGFVGTADLTVTLTDGWNLQQFTLNREGHAAETFKEAVGGFTSLVGALSEEAIEGLRFRPGLYRLEFDDKTGHLKSIVEVPAPWQETGAEAG